MSFLPKPENFAATELAENSEKKQIREESVL
jgi:hypothetical protein